METNNISDKGSKLRIKKFRIKPRIPSARRWLKQLAPDIVVTPEMEETLSKESDEFVKTLVPLAFYQTWLREEMPPLFDSYIKDGELEKAISVSALVATIGSGPEEKIGESLMNGATLRSHMQTALSEESADMALQFLLRLLREDAEQDDCEISDPILITDTELILDTLQNIGSDKEGIFLDQQNRVTPRFTRIGIAAWIPLSKKKKKPQLSKTR